MTFFLNVVSNSSVLLERIREKIPVLKKNDKAFVTSLLKAINWELGNNK